MHGALDTGKKCPDCGAQVFSYLGSLSGKRVEFCIGCFPNADTKEPHK